MAVADAAVKPSPLPPARISVAVLVFLRFVLDLVPALGRVLPVAARALVYLCFATSWVFSASSAAKVVARHACREGSAPLVILEALRGAALKASICVVLFLFLATVAVLLCGSCFVTLVAVLSGSRSEFNKSAFGAIRQEPTQKSIKLPRAAVLGLVADLAFILLIVAGFLIMMMSSPVEGSISQGEMIGSVIIDVGLFSLHVISCFVTIPALALDIWRKDQADRKSGLTVADCGVIPVIIVIGQLKKFIHRPTRSGITMN